MSHCRNHDARRRAGNAISGRMIPALLSAICPKITPSSTSRREVSA
jgi:hypothetical protein